MIDPNVWIAGLINPYGTPAGVIGAVMADRVVTVATRHLLDELAATLARDKFRRWVSLADATAFVHTLGVKADVVPEPRPGPVQVRDPDDEYLAALAHHTEAVLVTGDDDLLSADLDPPAVPPRMLLACLGQP